MTLSGKPYELFPVSPGPLCGFLFHSTSFSDNGLHDLQKHTHVVGKRRELICGGIEQGIKVHPGAASPDVLGTCLSEVCPGVSGGPVGNWHQKQLCECGVRPPLPASPRSVPYLPSWSSLNSPLGYRRAHAQITFFCFGPKHRSRDAGNLIGYAGSHKVLALSDRVSTA